MRKPRREGLETCARISPDRAAGDTRTIFSLQHVRRIPLFHLGIELQRDPVFIQKMDIALNAVTAREQSYACYRDVGRVVRYVGSLFI
jgi:hypothetical protein